MFTNPLQRISAIITKRGLIPETHVWKSPSCHRNSDLTSLYRSDVKQQPNEKFSKGGGLRRKNLNEKCLLIHVSTCNSFSLFPFQDDCLLFFALFDYSVLFLKFERRGGGSTV